MRADRFSKPIRGLAHRVAYPLLKNLKPLIEPRSDLRFKIAKIYTIGAR